MQKRTKYGAQGVVRPNTPVVRVADRDGRIRLTRFGVVPGQRYKVMVNSVGVIMLAVTDEEVTILSEDQVVSDGSESQ